MKNPSQLEICLIEAELVSIKKQMKLFFIPCAGWLLIYVASFYNLIKIKYKYWSLILVYCIVIGIGTPMPMIMFFKYFDDVSKMLLYFALPMFVIGMFLCIFSFFLPKKTIR